MSNEGETVPTAEVQSEETTTQPSKEVTEVPPTEAQTEEAPPVEAQPEEAKAEEAQPEGQAPETIQEAAPPATEEAPPATEATVASTEAYQDGAGTGNGFMTSQDFGVGTEQTTAGMTAGNFDASGGYSAHGTGGFHDMGMGAGQMGGDMGMAQMGAGGQMDGMQGQQFDQGNQIKSNPEHGKMLKKIGPSDLKMFIGGLSHETTTDKLKEYFATWGEVQDVDIKTDPQTGESRGFGFLLYKDEASIEEVVNNGPHNLDGKRIDPKKATKNSKIFIGGIKPETTNETLEEYFTTFGEVESIDRGQNKETGELKPFAFMIMKKENSAGQITSQKWHTIDEKRVECKLAVDRNKRGGGGNWRQRDNWGGGGWGGGYGGYGGYGYDNGPSFSSGYGQFGGGGGKQKRFQPY